MAGFEVDLGGSDEGPALLRRNHARSLQAGSDGDRGSHGGMQDVGKGIQDDEEEHELELSPEQAAEKMAAEKLAAVRASLARHFVITPTTYLPPLCPLACLPSDLSHS